MEKRNEILEKLSTDIDKTYSKIETELTSQLPEPPTKEEMLKPKNAVQAIIRNVIPAIVGIVTFLKPGNYGEMYYGFNAMIDAINKRDEISFQEALRDWKIKYDKAVQDKQNRLSALQIEVEKLKTRAELGDKQAQNELALRQLQLNTEMNLLKEIDKYTENSIKLLWKAYELKMKEKQIEEAAATRMATLKATKETRDVEAERKLIDSIVSKAINMVKEGITPHFKNALRMSARIYGINPDDPKNKELFEAIEREFGVESKTTSKNTGVLDWFGSLFSGSGEE